MGPLRSLRLFHGCIKLPNFLNLVIICVLTSYGTRMSFISYCSVGIGKCSKVLEFMLPVYCLSVHCAPWVHFILFYFFCLLCWLYLSSLYPIEEMLIMANTVTGTIKCHWGHGWRLHPCRRGFKPCEEFTWFFLFPAGTTGSCFQFAWTHGSSAPSWF